MASTSVPFAKWGKKHCAAVDVAASLEMGYPEIPYHDVPQRKSGLFGGRPHFQTHKYWQECDS